MGVNSGFYKFILLLHIFTVIAGFGPTIIAPFFGMEAKARRGREGLAIAEATEKVIATRAELFIYAVPIFGILLVLVSDDSWKFSQTWISLSFLLYIAALAIVHTVHMPNLKAMNRAMAVLAEGPPPGAGAATGGPPPQVAELEERGRKAGMVGGLLNLMLIAVLVLMIWKPGA
ncbi:MAG: DUF2269 family protein [Acidimicrobiales bacterium]